MTGDKESEENKGYFSAPEKKENPSGLGFIGKLIRRFTGGASSGSVTTSAKDPANKEEDENKGYFSAPEKKEEPSGLGFIGKLIRRFAGGASTSSASKTGKDPAGLKEGEDKGYFAAGERPDKKKQAAAPSLNVFGGKKSFFENLAANYKAGQNKQEEAEGIKEEGKNKTGGLSSPKKNNAGKEIAASQNAIAGTEITEEEKAEEPVAQSYTEAIKQDAQQESGGSAAATAKSGSAETALNFMNAPASYMARNIGSLGNQLAAGLEEDKNYLNASTPAVTAFVNTNTIENAQKPAVPSKIQAAVAKPWTPPKVAVRNDAPKFTPSAEANPQQAETEAAANGAQVSAQGNQNNAQIAQMPGEELVQGQEMNPAAQVKLSTAKASVQGNVSPEMQEYMNIDMSEGFRQQIDASASGLFSQTLEGTKNQIAGAKEKRDKDQEEAIANANARADELGKKAKDDQAQTVKDTRAQIGDEKNKSLSESKAVLAEYEGKVSNEKQSKLNEINAQIAAHENQANTALNEADKKVETEQKKADEKKKEEEHKAAEKKRNRKWWQKVGDFFSGIAKALAKAVTSIVNALASVVKSIVNAAKSLANTIINTCTSLVKKLLNTFASIVKGFLNVALAAFPSIRNRLNASIDKFVKKANEAIDKVAQGLKDSINKLCDTLTKIVDFAQNFMVSTIQGAVMMFEAIITGNFSDLPRIAFMTACNSLGLPGEELWGIVLKAGNQAMEIIKRPAVFLGNLIKAGEKGFGQFMSNIKQHLMSGLMGWLFGQVATAGITIPEKFDGPSIFMMVRQILGVTYEYVRERAVSKIGEKNVQRVEAVLAYLKRLFTEGPAALYEELKGKAEEMKNTIVEQIEDWAINTIIQKAVIKVTSMLIPGAGFVQAIYGMWQTLQFFIENIKKIAAVVNTLLDSLADIMRGAIGNAANLVEKTMVDTLPLVFTWLAKLIGIDGVGAKIKSIIDKLRTPVNTAVDFVIDGAIKLGTGAVNAVKSGASNLKDKAMAWWKKRTPFKTKKGEEHNVYFEGEPGNLKPMVASTPTEILPLLQRWRDTAQGNGKPELANYINGVMMQFVSCAYKSGINSEINNEKLDAAVQELGKIFGQFEDEASSRDSQVEAGLEAAGYADDTVDTEGADAERAMELVGNAVILNAPEEMTIDNYVALKGNGPVQFAAPSGGTSINTYKVKGKTHTVSYGRDPMGSIYFDKPLSVSPPFTTTIQNNKDATQILKTVGSIEYIDIVVKGKYVYPWATNKKARSRHFRAANLKKGFPGSGQPYGGWTWHHTTTPRGEMVPVLTEVHKRHNHNGGVLIW